MTQLTSILIAMDKLSQETLENYIFPYIDTPGNYIEEKDYYSSVEEYYKQNMGKDEYKKLLRWIRTHPNKVEKILRFSKRVK